jgi:LytS/YehU family sensor histidine kinase
MVKEYLDLEKTYYGNRIIANIKECGNLSGVDIAPLILLSLVQNCCEQSLISLQQKLLLDLEIKLVDDQLLFKLACNGYYEVINGISQQDKELKEALRRIELTYPRKHKIESYLENGSVKIILFLELEYSRHKTEKELLEYALA